MPLNPAVSFRGISKNFKEIRALDNVDLDVGPKQIYGLIGPDGAGKTTAIRIMATLMIPTKGAATVLGHDVVAEPQLVKSRIGYMPQNFSIYRDLTVIENVAFYAGIYRVAKAEMEERVNFWLERLGIADLQNQYPAQISGGQRQRTAIARTLVMNPDLLLMDEPFSSLDALTREDLERLTLELQAETGVTTAIVTHSIEEAVYLGQRLLLLRKAPHHEPLVIDNPGAGQPDYREQVEFQARCNHIRDLLGEQAHVQA